MLFLQGEDYKNRLLSNYNIYKYINIFDIVSSCNNLKSASILLNLSESAISKNIIKLEQLLGFRLFDRNGCKGLTLNTLGEKFKAYCSEIKKDINNIYNFANENREQNTIKICAHSLALNSYLFPAFKKIKNNRFKIELYSKTREDALKDMRNKKYDILLFPLDNVSIEYLDASSFDVSVLGMYKLCLFFKKNGKFNFIKNKQKNLSLNILQQVNIMPFNKDSSFNLYLQFEKDCQHSISFMSDKMDVLLQGVNADFWVAAIGQEALHSNYKLKNIETINIQDHSNVYTDIKWCFVIQKDLEHNKQNFAQTLYTIIKKLFDAKQ